MERIIIKVPTIEQSHYDELFANNPFDVALNKSCTEALGCIDRFISQKIDMIRFIDLWKTTGVMMLYK